MPAKAREVGIKFNDSMINAIMDGQKWQTRRPLASRPPKAEAGDWIWVREAWAEVGAIDPPYLVYRATYPDCLPSEVENVPKNIHEAGYKWQPSIHMPRWAARIWLPLVRVWEERVQEITEKCVVAEGLRCFSKDRGLTFKWGLPDEDGYPGTDNSGYPWSQWDQDSLRAFAIQIWNSVYGHSYPWSNNPLVRVYEWDFKQIIVKR